MQDFKRTSAASYSKSCTGSIVRANKATIDYETIVENSATYWKDADFSADKTSI